MTHRSFLRVDLFLALSGLVGVAACSNAAPSAPAQAHQETVRSTSAALDLIGATTGLFPTGVDIDGVTRLTDGVTDPHYACDDGSAFAIDKDHNVTTGVIHVWADPPDPGTWISCTPDTNGAGDTTFQYTTTLTVPAGIPASTIEVSGSWACDNECWIVVNGNSVVGSSDAPAKAGDSCYATIDQDTDKFTIPAGTFQDGENTITFVVFNGDPANPDPTANPTGLLVSNLTVTGGCTADANCGDGNFCITDDANAQYQYCAPTVANGESCTKDSMCTSGVCDNDSLCGYASGGSCDKAGTTCRSGECSTNGTCLIDGTCATDADCGSGKYCNTSNTCVVQHTNGDGPCTDDNAASMCVSGVCGTDSNCGYRDGASCTGNNQCRPGSFCGADGTCIPAANCNVDADCTDPLTPTCNTNTDKCEAAPTEDDAGATPGTGTDTGSDASTTNNASLGGGGSSCTVSSGAQHGAGVSSVLGFAAIAFFGLLRRRRG
ncbi:MAG: hypothetical protein FWD69_08865 [Polyangiaceae bacterium]|nr:hypothetical protein [Polyangiaceae bacterium]